MLLVFVSGWEPAIRLAGMTLQLLGLGTVVCGIRKTAKSFGHPTLSALTRGWFAQVPRWHLPPQTPNVGTGRLSVSKPIIIGWGVSGANPNATVEERLARLEQGLTVSQTAMAQLGQTQKAAQLEASAGLLKERQAREIDVATIRKTLEEVTAGDLHLEKLGAFWLALGIMLATASNEIVRLFGLR